jgi:hypothetical protein
VSEDVESLFPNMDPLVGNLKTGREFNVTESGEYVIVEPKFVRVLPKPLLSVTEVTTDDVAFEVTICVTSAASSHTLHPEMDVGFVKDGGVETNG